LDQKILNLIKRDQTKNQVAQATKLLRDAGFKICYHIMPNLPGSTPRRDFAMFKELFDNESLRPDQLKIYPRVVLKQSLLYRWYKQNKYQTYTDKVLIDLLAKMKQYVPAYVRIERVYRDVPSQDIVQGCCHTNIREMAQKVMRDQGIKCVCIRCREVRDKIKNQISKVKNTNQKSKIFTKKYSASQGTEYFISCESPDRKILYAFLRLRFPSNDVKTQLKPLRNTAIIRELHTYGPLAAINLKPNNLTPNTYSQHKGLGKKLMAHAEKIAKTAKYAKIAIIAGVGVRGYYRRLGYRLEKKFGYMVKSL
jgi:elongator complex protein 3